MTAGRREQLLRDAIRRIATSCPRLVAQCYWAGTSAIALEETAHRESFDLDFHSQHALVDTRPLLAELQLAFPSALEVVQSPDSFGSGFTATLNLEGDEKVTVQVFAAFDRYRPWRRNRVARRASGAAQIERQGGPTMKRTYRFIEPSGVVACLIGGERIDLPVFAGVLKHPTVEQLRGLLMDPVVASKYTRDALRKLPWSALRRFPRAALLACLPLAGLSASRRLAVEFMLGITT